MNSQNYRADIDGLRALSIILVIIYHAFPSFLPAGFIGVDIFFVISGFLISTILFNDIKNNNISFSRFYSNRIKRIFPALLCTLAICYIVGWFTLLPEDFKLLGKHIASGTGFIQNFTLLQEAGYFDKASESKPLMHLWSLAIEEQFYLFFPLFIFIFWRLRLNVFFALCFLFIISFSLNLYTINSDSAKTFFSPQTRFWELISGCLLAYLSLNKFDSHAYSKVFLSEKISNIFSCLAILAVVAAAFCLSKNYLYPGYWALIPIISATVVISTPNSWINKKILSNKYLVSIGLISYPLYLWHWPILSFFRITTSAPPTLAIGLFALFLSFTLAWLTYRFIERPLRYGFKSKKITLYLVLAAICMGCIGLATFKNGGIESRAFVQSKSHISKSINWDSYWIQPDCLKKYSMEPCLEKGEEPKLILLGDSHANHLFPGLAEYYTHGILSAGTCAPLEGISMHVRKNQKLHPCATNDFIGKNLELIEQSNFIKFAIISSFWRSILDGEIKNPRELEFWGGAWLTSKYVAEENLDNFNLVLNGLFRTISALQIKGVKTILVRDTPDIAEDLFEFCHLNSRWSKDDCFIKKSDFTDNRSIEDKLINQIKLSFPEVKIIDPSEILCEDEKCYLMKNNVLFYRDQHHLSVSGSNLLGQQIVKSISEKSK